MNKKIGEFYYLVGDKYYKYYQPDRGKDKPWFYDCINERGEKYLEGYKIGICIGFDALQEMLDAKRYPPIDLSTEWTEGHWKYKYVLLEGEEGVFIAGEYNNQGYIFHVKISDHPTGGKHCIQDTEPKKRKLIRSSA